jgi:hypothetical protein
MIKTALFCILLLFNITLFSQSALIKLMLEEAEIAFNNNDFRTTIQKLDELENIQGASSSSLFLRIVCQYNLYIEAPYKDESQYDLLVSLRVNTRSYLEGMESFGLDDKYREIYRISQSLNESPVSKEEWLRSKENHDDNEEKRRHNQRALEARERETAAIKLEEQRRQEQKRREEMENEKYFIQGVGYYAGRRSLLGMSYHHTGRNLGFGIDWRFGPNAFEDDVFKSENPDFIYNPIKDVTMNFGFMANLSKPILYPVFGYLGLGYGQRGNGVRFENQFRSGVYVLERVRGLEIEFGTIIKVGEGCMIRLGISTLNFSQPEFTFGIYIAGPGL